jgi:teichuronic acid biosynthesis glycosyltransferase TuaC
MARTMRALIVTNMYPSPARPALGSFVADQVQALRRLNDPELELEVFAFAPGGYRGYANAARQLRARCAASTTRPLDVVHAHFGLTIWPARAVPARHRAVTLHGTDLAHPRSRALTLAALPGTDLIGVVSTPLAQQIPRWAGRERAQVLPCGVDLHRFHRIDRHTARRELGLKPDGPYLLFPSDPRRPEKRYDQALQAAAGSPLLTLTDIAPDRVPLYVNAANAVLIPSEREGFGLAVLESLACDVPVLATPVGIAPEVLAGLPGALCQAFDASAWRGALARHLSDPDPRIDGRPRAEPYSSDRMAARVLAAWKVLSTEG